jgi:hypothetical protein
VSTSLRIPLDSNINNLRYYFENFQNIEDFDVCDLRYYFENFQNIKYFDVC